MTETNVALRQRAAECSQAHLDKNADAILDEAERQNDLKSISLIVSRVASSSSISERLQAKITKSVTNVVNVFEKSNSVESLHAIELLLTRSPSRLTKFHARLRSALDVKLFEDEITARCFAALPGVLPSRLREQEYVNTFESLLGKLKESLQKKQLQPFRAITEGLIAFVNGIGRLESKHAIRIRPGPLIVIISEAVMVDKNFHLCGMRLLNKICQCCMRKGLAWARQVCEIVETCMDMSDDNSEETSQISTYVGAQTAIEQLGFGVGVRLAPRLVSLLRKDLIGNNSLTDNLLREACKTLNVIYASGAPIILGQKLRSELDSIVLKAAWLLAHDGSKQPQTRVLLVETLTMAIRTSSEHNSTTHCQVRNQGLKLLLKLANKYEYSSEVRLAAWKSLHSSSLHGSEASTSSTQGSSAIMGQPAVGQDGYRNSMNVIPDHVEESMTTNTIVSTDEQQKESSSQTISERHQHSQIEQKDSETKSNRLREDCNTVKSTDHKRLRVVQPNTESSDSDDEIPDIV